MNWQNRNYFDGRLAVNRLTAFWALTETGLGGFLHAFRLPFTGLFVGGLAILWMALIARFTVKPAKTILTSGALVLVLKGVLSPQSPPTAYFAVGIQILLGALFFLGKRWLGPKTLVLTVLTVLLSAIQKVIILTLLFGNTLWQSIDVLGAQITAQMSGLLPKISASSWLIGLFFGFYALGGLLIGMLNSALVEHDFTYRRPPQTLTDTTSSNKKSKIRISPIVWFALAALLIVAAQGYFLNSWALAFSSLARALLITALWFAVLLPILRLSARRRSSDWQERYRDTLSSIRQFIPILRALLAEARKVAKAAPNRKLRTFFTVWLEYALSYDIEHHSADGTDHQRQND